jgi:hypothetical protein
MPNWSDDEGRCHFTVNGVPCHESPVGCPMHAAKVKKTRERASTVLRVEALADELYAALKSYYHECGCQQTKMDAVNQAAYAALRKYENWSGR